MKEQAKKKLQKHTPKLLIAHPMCGAPGQMRNLTYSKMNLEEMEQNFKPTMAHLEFAMDLCEAQTPNGKKLMFEHHVNAISRQIAMPKCTLQITNVAVIDFDVFYEMKTVEHSKIAKKKTRTMTNPTCSARKLTKTQCMGHREHVPLVKLKTHHCETYVGKFCQEICLAIKRELAKRSENGDPTMEHSVLAIGKEKETHPHDKIDDVGHLYHGQR